MTIKKITPRQFYERSLEVMETGAFGENPLKIFPAQEGVQYVFEEDPLKLPSLQKEIDSMRERIEELFSNSRKKSMVLTKLDELELWANSIIQIPLVPPEDA